jgi:hypothetical protein
MRKIIATAAGAALVALGVAAPATATSARTAAHVQVSPDFTCEPGYAAWQNYATKWYLLSYNIEGQPLVTDESTPSCWHFPDDGDIGEIEDEAGYCAQFGYGHVEDAVCSGIPAQLWLVVPDDCWPGTQLVENEWALGNGNGGNYAMNGPGPNDSDVNLLDGTTCDTTSNAWFHG